MFLGSYFCGEPASLPIDLYKNNPDDADQVNTNMRENWYIESPFLVLDNWDNQVD